MGFYEDGIGDTGALLYTPGAIKAEAVTTDQEIKALLTDVRTSKLPGKVKTSFQKFFDEWVSFYKNHTGWFDRLWFSNMEKIQDYRKRGVDWRGMLSGQGVKMTTPSPKIKFAGLELPTMPLWGKVAIGAAAAGLLYYIFRQFVPASSARTLDTNQGNPPQWVHPDDIGKWERAVDAVKPDWKDYGNPYAVVTHVYKHMGGRITDMRNADALSSYTLEEMQAMSPRSMRDDPFIARIPALPGADDRQALQALGHTGRFIRPHSAKRGRHAGHVCTDECRGNMHFSEEGEVLT